MRIHEELFALLPPRIPIGRAQFREIRVTYFSFYTAVQRVTNGSIFMAHPPGTPTTPADSASYEALAVNLRQPLRRDNIRLPLNFPSPPACLFGLSHLMEQEHTLLLGIANDYYCQVKSIFFGSDYVANESEKSFVR